MWKNITETQWEKYYKVMSLVVEIYLMNLNIVNNPINIKIMNIFL